MAFRKYWYCPVCLNSLKQRDCPTDIRSSDPPKFCKKCGWDYDAHKNQIHPKKSALKGSRKGNFLFGYYNLIIINNELKEVITNGWIGTPVAIIKFPKLPK